MVRSAHIRRVLHGACEILYSKWLPYHWIAAAIGFSARQKHHLEVSADVSGFVAKFISAHPRHIDVSKQDLNLFVLSEEPQRISGTNRSHYFASKVVKHGCYDFKDRRFVVDHKYCSGH
jgi:hypothetical protein